MDETERRNEILEAYCEATDPRERRELLESWLKAGGRQLIDDAVTAGLSTLRRSPDNGDA